MRREGRGEADGGGERQRRERGSKSKVGGRVNVENKERDGTKGEVEGRGQGSEGWKEEMCWWISLGLGERLFHERVHSTPPSSVAPAGWRPLGSGNPVGTLTCSITAEHRGELRVEIYFL